MSLAVTVYVKLVNGKFVDVLPEKNSDLLTYFDEAVVYCKYILDTAVTSLYFQKKDLVRFRDYKNSTVYAEMERKYQDMQKIRDEVLDCQTDIEKCEYYCKYNHIEYIPKRVEFN